MFFFELIRFCIFCIFSCRNGFWNKFNDIHLFIIFADMIERGDPLCAVFS